jgi:hypothetical protein
MGYANPDAVTQIANGLSTTAWVSSAKMPGLEEADDGVRDVALERLRARRQEERVVLAPHCEERWLSA